MSDTPETSLLHQRGRFTLATQIIQDIPEVAVKVLAGVLVTRCEHRFAEQAFTYEAISEHFEAVEDGEPLPSYDVSWDEDTETATWTRSPAPASPGSA